MNPTQDILAESTAVATKAANMIGKDYQQGVGVIPVDVVDNPPPSQGLQLPPVSSPQLPTALLGLQEDANQRATAAQPVVDQRLNNLSSLYSQQAGLTDQYNQQVAALDPLQQELADLDRRLTRRATQFEKNKIQDERDIANLQGQGTDSRLVGRNQVALQRERTFERRAEAAELAGLAALAELKRGNIQASRDNIREAIELKSRDFERAIQFEAMLLSRADTQLSAAQKDQRDARLRALDVELDAIKQADNLTAQAIASGGATEEEVTAMMRSTNPQEQAGIAQSIIARTAASDRAFDRYTQNQSLALRGAELQLARDRFEAESSTFGSGTITLENGEKAVVSPEGEVTPISQIDFDDPSQIDALPVSDITKAVMGGYARTKDLTPTDKSKVAAELAKIGFNPNTYIVNKLDALVQTWAQMPDSSRGYVEGLKFWESKTNADVATFESQRTLLTREIARLFDVGVLSDQDVQAYKDAMPSRQDSDLGVVLSKASGIAGAATGKNTENVGKYYQLPDGRTAIVGLDGDTLLDPATGLPLE